MFWKKEKKQLSWMYEEKELDIVEKHIALHFGEWERVLHELVSPDIHVDIYIVKPTAQRNHYTLVTVGMGAHRMNVPKDCRKDRIDRAELLIALPPDWKVEDKDPRWDWPVYWLRVMARLPIKNDTWLGYGHTVTNEDPLADNTELNGIMLTMPYFFGDKAGSCELPKGDRIVFFQALPVYESEMKFKNEKSAEALEDLFPDDFDMVVDIHRKKAV